MLCKSKFVETAVLETALLIEDLMQTKVLKGARDFENKDFAFLKGNGLIRATLVEFKELTELSTVLEGKMERGTEVALSLVLMIK